MTYRTLLTKLNQLAGQNPERLNDSVTVYDPALDEYFDADKLEFADEKFNDVLDNGHPFITLLK